MLGADLYMVYYNIRSEKLLRFNQVYNVRLVKGGFNRSDEVQKIIAAAWGVDKFEIEIIDVEKTGEE